MKAFGGLEWLKNKGKEAKIEEKNSIFITIWCTCTQQLPSAHPVPSLKKQSVHRTEISGRYLSVAYAKGLQVEKEREVNTVKID